MRSSRPRLVSILALLLLCLAATRGSASTVAQQSRAEQARGPSLSGEYRGAIGTQHLVLNLTQGPDGTISGRLTLPDHDNVTVTLPLDTVAFKGDVLNVEFKAIAASFSCTRGRVELRRHMVAKRPEHPVDPA